ncbi:MAG: hypothetical protein GX095_05045 [Clostridiales bacterium]|jgi:hypothetical protein|nr:hypothetical protein [Clostridiales bacterium]HOB63896.1 hypothetical protein [Clostridia bacterium]HOK82558.1 hypothetical protein [Clostridia bacterium]
MKQSNNKSNSYSGYSDIMFSGDENIYYQSKRDKASPYNLSYLAAWNLRPKYVDPFIPVPPRPGEPKRLGILIVLCILMVALIAVLALSFLEIVPDYTALFTKVGAEEGAEGDTLIGVSDIVYSTLRKLGMGATDVDPSELIFYTDCLENIDAVGTSFMIAYYALPVSIILTLVIAIYVFIKGIAGVSARMKRRKFTYIIFLQLLFTLLGLVSGFVWSGVQLAEIMNYITGSASFNLGIGFYALIGIEVLALIFSFFAYKSKAQIMREAQEKADEINRKNLEIYKRRLPPNSIIMQ